MVKKGDMFYAWTSDAELAKRAECGGAVTTLLKYALENNIVDAVLAVRKGADLYDAVPTIITDPKELDQTAGSLHCGTMLLSKLVKNYLGGANNFRLAMTVKGCDAMGLYELAKRQQVNLDNVLMIGVNCGGSVSPVTARKMIADKFEVDPDTVHKEEIDKGQFIIEYEGGHKGISIDDLEEEGYGRRPNCRRCKMKIPRQADLACGNWGVIGDKAGKATFVEVCSEKGANLLKAAVDAGVLKTEAPNPKGIVIRGKVEGAMFKLADKWRKRDFEALGDGRERLAKIVTETSRCIKCYACIEQCPICYCVECSTKKPYLVEPGTLPVPFMFHLIRFAHIADSCVNCGQCEENCPMEIPNSLFMHAQQCELEQMFGHVPGVDMELPLLALVEEKDERARLAATGSDQIFDIFK
ncbi:MAG TPA: Coenzyme F420 hydrogenase/dehydrogenase, beta subunit C-terminal domain [Methanoregulaceae archaeon]|jgi:formate dehydrogenase subunit beta|nr:Coenzyme F420 hydrogenase/dehydrogenase, beta subunit C-terminal domain [Methanolinea sp.]MDD3091128.1 Coenzyme F420 hydrogenase/dehydrogenase, beta subunit C-terminal domain [Methanoregulaceae archaeon]MDD5048853.1 Coenzyme F420 hydrogenase/dehydrogenase, beta subunit C-terminal domain [Methanoregulaceae archaeon]MDD5685010.1 Coenzyme F420 hydrogenase/dehydrogenase, beta subunit C-terminal domain [Methanoregulaceae archaeon]HOP67460.1 Coenzyme F420 hydrogenase/dehydrogenase, beta subunit C-